jgi:ribosome-associated protein
VHIMHPTVREFYNLEEVWGGKTVRMKTAASAEKKKKPAKKRAKAKGTRAKR